MLYYPYPSIPDGKVLAVLPPFEPDSLIGFHRAWELGNRALEQSGAPSDLVGGRLELLGGRPVYQLRHEAGDGLAPALLLDATTGAVLSPIPPALAESAARAIAPHAPATARVELLPRADHYMMDVAYAPQFPAYRVRFADPGATAIYVSARGGNPFGIVTRVTRFTTWTGTVPHWFYFIWLYDRPGLWDAAFIAAGSLIILLALTGIIWGSSQLLRQRRRPGASVSPYRGLPRWHHLSGIVFGVLVLTWTASGLYQNFGAGNLPRAGQAARIRGGPTRWQRIALSESAALRRARESDASLAAPVAIDLTQLDDRPEYVFHFPAGRALAVDAATGHTRAELSEQDLVRAGKLLLGDSTPPATIEKLSAYDSYYYARHGRTLPLPVWRLTFADAQRTRLYLDPVSGAPQGFVDAASRRARWLRDAVHSLDLPGFGNRRPLWDLTILPLLLGGLLLSGTGVGLVIRRIGRT